MILLSMMLLSATLPLASAADAMPLSPSMAVSLTDCVCADPPGGCPQGTMTDNGCCFRCCLATLPAMNVVQRRLVSIMIEVARRDAVLVDRALLPDTPPPRSA